MLGVGRDGAGELLDRHVATELAVARLPDDPELAPAELRPKS